MISTAGVRCEAQFVQSPIKQSGPSDVIVTNTGDLRWEAAAVGTPPGIINLDYQSYRGLGWTVAASSAATRFTNDQTGHGMSVSIETVDKF